MVGLVEVAIDDAVSSSPLVENEQCCHQMPQIPFPIGCSLPRFDVRPKLRSGHDDSRLPKAAHCSMMVNDSFASCLVFPFCGNLQDRLDGMVDYRSIITFFPRRLI